MCASLPLVFERYNFHVIKCISHNFELPASLLKHPIQRTCNIIYSEHATYSFAVKSSFDMQEYSQVIVISISNVLTEKNLPSD